jgi:hypothetical protein
MSVQSCYIPVPVPYGFNFLSYRCLEYYVCFRGRQNCLHVRKIGRNVTTLNKNRGSGVGSLKNRSSVFESVDPGEDPDP